MVNFLQINLNASRPAYDLACQNAATLIPSSEILIISEPSVTALGNATVKSENDGCTIQILNNNIPTKGWHPQPTHAGWSSGITL